MLDRREMIVVNPEPVMMRSGDPELAIDATTLSRDDEAPCVRKESIGTQENTADESANRSRRSSRKAVVSWMQIPEVWAALERRFA
jgi:hypothetical protein